jgi:O-antigen ligase
MHIKNKHTSNVIYVIPSIIIVLALAMNDVVFSSSSFVSENDGGMTTNPRRFIILGVAYFIGVLIYIKRINYSVFIIKKNILYIALLLLALLSLFWSSYPVNVVLNFAHYAGFLLVAITATNHYKYVHEDIFRFFAIIVGVALLFSIIASVFFPNIGVHSITGRWQGVAGNPNTLGIVCILSIWANISDLLTRKKNINVWLNIFLLIITIICLIGANSTTSFVVSLFAATGSWFLSSLKNKPYNIKIIRIIFICWLGAMMVLITFLIKPELLTLQGVFSLVGKDTTFTGRTNIWLLAVKAIDLKQYFGWSFDSNRSALDHLGLNRGQFHNGYLDLIVRGGYVSIAVFIAIVLQTIYRIGMLSKIDYSHSVAWLILLACILIHNITESSIMRETHLLWYFFVFMLCILPTYSVDRK